MQSGEHAISTSNTLNDKGLEAPRHIVPSPDLCASQGSQIPAQPKYTHEGVKSRVQAIGFWVWGLGFSLSTLKNVKCYPTTTKKLPPKPLTPNLRLVRSQDILTAKRLAVRVGLRAHS